MSTTESPPVDLSAVDFCDPRTYDDPWAVYAALRDLDHLHRDDANDLYIAPRHEDVFHISRDNDLYCSRFGVRPKVAGDMSIVSMDGAEHLRQRRLVSMGFTPRQVRRLIPHLREITNEALDRIAPLGQIDFVEQFAMHVPLIVICELLGLDPEQRERMYRWSDDMMAGDGHVEADDPVLLRAATSFGEYATMCLELIAERRESPKDDLISVLTQAFDQGELAKDFKAYQGISDEDLERMRDATSGTLSDDELLAFLTILLVAGNETTRNAITGGLYGLSRHPDQRDLMLEHLDDDGFMDAAMDELVRYVTPVLGFIRTVTRDHTYRGTELREGDRILMLYGSANRDERVFSRPGVLDLTRDPNPSLAFGIGPHFCVGYNLAKTELRIVFQEMLRRLPDITIPDPAIKRWESSLVLALHDMVAEFTPTEGCPVAH